MSDRYFRMGHVFLSHSAVDVGMAKHAADALAAAGYEVWWDEQLPAHRSFHDVIDERLRASDAVVVLWSRAAAKSDWVRAEADFARQRGKLIQASLDGDLPPIPFNQIQCAKLAGWNGEADHPGWKKVVQGVRAIVGGLPPSADASAPENNRWWIPRWALLAVALAVVVGIGVYYFMGSSTSPLESTAVSSFTPRVAVLPFETIGGSTEATEFAAQLEDKVAGSLSENFVQTLTVSSATELTDSDRLAKLRALGVNFALRGSVRRSEGNLLVRAYVDELDSGFTVWSMEFARAVDRRPLLLSEVAAALTEVAHTLTEALEQPDSGVDAQVLSLYLKASDALGNPGRESVERVVVMLEEAIARAPKFAAAHGMLALQLAVGSGADEVRVRLARARREAEVAIALYPATGAAYDALFALARFEAPADFVLADDVLRRGFANAPNFPFLHLRRCQFLMGVGRIHDAMTYCRTATALRPLAPPPAFRLVSALALSGDDGAMAALERAAANHPDHYWVNVLRFEIYLDSGRIRDAMAMLEDPSTRPEYLSAHAVPVVRAYLGALESRNPRDVDSAMTQLLAANSAGTLPSAVAGNLAARIGRTDDAFAMLARIDTHSFAEVWPLFGVALRGLRHDPRFMTLVAPLGHVVYWQKTGTWPDYCADATLPYRCEEEAGKALASIQ